MIEVEEQEEVETEHEEAAVADDQEVELVIPLEQMEISAHALNGSFGFRTLRVTGYHSKKPLHILIDIGSSHNFIDPEVVKGLGCQVISTTPRAVTSANGNDMQVSKMCNISWLLQGCGVFSRISSITIRVLWCSLGGAVPINSGRYQYEF